MPVTYAAIQRLGWPGEVPPWPFSPAGFGIYLDLDRVKQTLSALPADRRRTELVELHAA